MEDAPTVANLAFVESLYDRYLTDPGSVPEEWRAYFATTEEPNRTSLGPRFQARSIFAAAPGNGGAADRAVARAAADGDGVVVVVETAKHFPPLKASQKQNFLNATDAMVRELAKAQGRAAGGGVGPPAVWGRPRPPATRGRPPQKCLKPPLLLPGAAAWGPSAAWGRLQMRRFTTPGCSVKSEVHTVAKPLSTKTRAAWSFAAQAGVRFFYFYTWNHYRYRMVAFRAFPSTVFV